MNKVEMKFNKILLKFGLIRILVLNYEDDFGDFKYMNV